MTPCDSNYKLVLVSCVTELYLCAGVREVTLCKDAKGRCGMSLFSVSKGVFVCFVAGGSPAAMAGLRFGDQILTVSIFVFLVLCVLHSFLLAV